MKPTMTDEERREASRAYQRAYRKANPEKFREYDAKKDKAQKTAYMRTYYAENKERMAEQNRAWRKANKADVRTRNRAWKAANKEKVRAGSKKYYWSSKDRRADVLRANYTKQNRKRPILLIARQEVMLGRKKPDACDACGGNDGGIVFDHCHERGHPRGWLCDRCNVALGCLRDDIDRLRKLTAYLERNRENTSPQLALSGL